LNSAKIYKTQDIEKISTISNYYGMVLV